MRRRFCWLRAHRHHYVPGIERGDHIWKVCSECGHHSMTLHVSCNKGCWAGPA